MIITDGSGDASVHDAESVLDAVSGDVDDPDPGPPPVDTPVDAQPVDTPPDVGPQLICPPGIVGCAEGDRLVCSADGTAFELEPCGEGLVCAGGQCVTCATDADCAAAEVCDDGECVLPPLVVATPALPTGLVGVPYAVQLVAAGGLPPYSWSLEDITALPDGVALGPDGALGGVPLQAGVWPVPLVVEDDAGGTATATLELEVVEGDLAITTPSPLPGATEGEAYSTIIEATGGTPPYFFGALDALPPGLALAPDGTLSGVATAEGTHEFTLKAFDNGFPTLSATRTYELSVGLAPLEIVADQQLDLFITKIITLPLIVVIDGIPVPYSAQLQAKGGKKPYHWVEEPLPGFLQALIPQGGLPAGLSIASNGTISGGVSDASLVITVQIPFTQIELSGFFFQAKVNDSQDPAESRTALFIIPTVPIGGP